MYLYNTWEETGDESVECRALRKFLRQIELHKTGQVYKRLLAEHAAFAEDRKLFDVGEMFFFC